MVGRSVGAELVSDQFLEFLGSGQGARCRTRVGENHGGHDSFAPLSVRQPDCRRVGHSRMLDEHGFDLTR